MIPRNTLWRKRDATYESTTELEPEAGWLTSSTELRASTKVKEESSEEPRMLGTNSCGSAYSSKGARLEAGFHFSRMLADSLDVPNCLSFLYQFP